MPVDLPESESISGADINLTVCAVSNCVLCCNLAESKSVLKMCISKHCHEVTGFLSWITTYCLTCAVQQRSRVKDSSLLARKTIARKRRYSSFEYCEMEPLKKKHLVQLQGEKKTDRSGYRFLH